MTTYYMRLAGPSRERTPIEADDVAQARNEAVRYLGKYLSEHPAFAEEGHWQLNIESETGQSLVHVIVATVIPRSASR